MAHVELINPAEKLAGYRPPQWPATRAALLVDLARTDGGRAQIGYVVWKVARRSVTWHLRGATNGYRRLHLYSRAIRCSIVGSHRDWWFVAVSIASATRSLSRPDRPSTHTSHGGAHGAER